MLMTDSSAIKQFAFAGKATLTVSSGVTNARFTYQINRKKGCDNLLFVKVLVGPDNSADYAYIGVINGTTFRTTAKSAQTPDAPSVRAIKYLCERVLSHPEAPLPPGLEVRHDGKCGRCKRLLTVPESIDLGIGPECASKMGIALPSAILKAGRKSKKPLTKEGAIRERALAGKFVMPLPA